MVDFIVQYWLEVLFTLLLSGFGFVIRMIWSQFKALKLGMQAILRNDIISLYNKCMAREPSYTKIYEMTSMEQMYIQYHALGGNGVIKNLYEDFLDLPTEAELKHEGGKGND